MAPKLPMLNAAANARTAAVARPRPRARMLAWLGSAALAALILVPVMVGAVGCARRGGARAESREVRLTSDGAAKKAPRFSPDGRSLVFAQRLGDPKGTVGVFVMSASGGDARRISPDTMSLLPLRWSSDGASVYCIGPDAKDLYQLGLDGSLRSLGSAGPLSRFSDVSADGATRVIVSFRQDNYDVDVVGPQGPTGELFPTPEWESEGTLGPDADQVTVVETATFQSPLSTISLRTRGEPGRKILPLPEGQKYAPRWSPDGRQLAYVVSSNGQLDVWVYDVATARATPAITDPEDSGCPEWSPDGEWLAFCRTNRTSRLFLGEPDDSGRRQLTHGPAYDYEPKASPDGKWIAFLRRSPPGTDGAEALTLNVMPMTGGEARELDLGGRVLPAKGSEVVWSDDGQQLAFSAREASSGLDIYRIRRDGTGLLRVTVDPGDEIDPRWSPDGRWIAYTKVGGGETQVAVLPANGGVARILSPEGVPSEGGAWSPDGSEVAYLTIRLDGSFELWRSPVAAPERRRLVLASEDLPWPLRWTPDGRNLLLVRRSGQDWYFSEYELESGRERRIATEGMTHGGTGMYIKFLSEGEKYRELLCPGGVLMADGEQTSDIFMIPARDLGGGRQASAGGQGFSWIARASWGESY